MYRIWQMIHPMRAMVLLYTALAIIAFMIHFILLSTERYNWLGPQKTSQFHGPAMIIDGADKVRIG